MSSNVGRTSPTAAERSWASHLVDLDMQARYHRDRHRLYAARLGSSRPVSLSKLRQLQRTREVAESHLRRAKAASAHG